MCIVVEVTLIRSEYGNQRTDQPANVNFKSIIRVLNVIFLSDTKCKISFIKIRFNRKRKKASVNKWMGISAIKRGGGLTLNGECHKNISIFF